MPYRTPGRFSTQRKQRITSRRSYVPNQQPDYGYRGTGTRRHEFVAQVFNGDLAANDYIPITMLKFKRTFDAANPDVEPTPTVSNNYQTSSVMNGSKVYNFQTKILINSKEGTDSNTSIKTFWLDVYSIELSFLDGQMWEDFDQATQQNALIDFDGSTAAGNYTAGEVNYDSPNVTLSANFVKSSKFTQRYMKFIGRVEIPVAQTIHLNFNRVPPKCRRSNSGMFWGIVLHNNQDINGSQIFNCSVAQDQTFDEQPTDERLPFIY